MKIKLSIDETLDDLEINICTPTMNDEVKEILEAIEICGKDKVYVKCGEEIHNINLNDVISFYTDEKSVYLKTKDGKYKIKYRLYELEKRILSKKFLRISNAIIVNEEHIKCFDTAQAGNVIVKLDDGSIEYVSKRRIPTILKKLKEKEI